jgi:hypothetical protein
MSTSFRSGYVRGIEGLLSEDDGVDAGFVSDLLVANTQHLYDAHHSHIVNIVTPTGGTPTLRQTDPNSVYHVLVGRWAYEPIEARDGGSSKVVYRIRYRRSGGSGSITIGVRIAPIRIGPFFALTSETQNEHTMSSTTAETVRGELYVPGARFASDFALRPDGSGSGALRRTAHFEVWCSHSGSKPTVELLSVMARQYVRIDGTTNYELREDGSYELREDGGIELRE